MIWERLAGLHLVVEGYTLERLEAGERITTQIRLHGGDAEGLGEDIGLDQDALQAAGASLPFAGSWTLERFCDHLATLEQWPEPPEWEMARRWRNWAYESAALDLALAQAGLPLHDALGREPRPVTFVNSLGLGDPPSADTIARRLERYPSVGFKLDAQPTWTPEIVAAVAETGAVRTIDFKGRYGLEVEDAEALGRLYDAVLEGLPDVTLEDPHDLPEINERLAPHAERISHDAPVARAADISTPIINVKPSRIGSLRALSEVYEHCTANGIAMYGGGMGELGRAREQIILLASLFHPDAHNDVAPSAFNLPDPPAGLPTSPLAPKPPPAGFRWLP